MRNIQRLNNHNQLKTLMLQVQSDIKSDNGPEAIKNIHECLGYMVHQFTYAWRRDLIEKTFSDRLTELCQSGTIKSDYAFLHNRIIDIKESGADIQNVRKAYDSLLILVDDFLDILEFPVILQTNHPQLDEIVLCYRVHLLHDNFKEAAKTMKQAVEYMVYQYEREYAQDLRIENGSTKCVILAQRRLVTEKTASVWKTVYELGNIAVTWNCAEDINVDEVKRCHALLEDSKREFYARFEYPSNNEINNRNMYVHKIAYQPKMTYTTHISKEEMDKHRHKLDQEDKERKKTTWVVGGIALATILLSSVIPVLEKVPIIPLLMVYVIYRLYKGKENNHKEEK